jgi:hypothetical protein
MAEISGTDVTEIRRKSFLEENDEERSSIFWSTDPLEWSPIGNGGDGSRPLSAVEYLSSKPVVSEAEPQQVVPANEGPHKKEETLPENGPLLDVTAPVSENEKDEGKFGKKILPILVVILLLIGLLGALLSSFLFPDPSSNSSGDAQPVTPVSISFLSTTMGVAHPGNNGVVSFKNMFQVTLESHLPVPEV